MAHYNGTSGDVKYGITALHVTEWNATEETEPLPVTDKGSGGYQEVIGGIKKCEVSVTANWDSAINEGAPPRVTSGSTVTLTCYLTDGGDALTGQFFVQSVEYTCPVDGVVEYSFTATSNGSYSLPGNNAS